MSFENPSNRGRALKIVDTLSHIEKSAKSNRASPDEIALMVAPVVEMLRLMGGLRAAEAAEGTQRHATPPTAAPGAEPVQGAARRETPLSEASVPGGRWSASQNAPAWAIIRDAATTAPLSDLAAAMSICARRIEAAADELRAASGDGKRAKA
jgi:hypothetical protein